MPADKTQTGRRALQPACDACHIRRVKCSHDQPCAHCKRLGLTCTYTKAHTAKKTAGKRIEALRQAEKARMYENRQGGGIGHASSSSPSSWAPQLPSLGGGAAGGAMMGDGWNGNSSSSANHGNKMGTMYPPHHHHNQGVPPLQSSDPRFNSTTNAYEDRGNANASLPQHFYTNASSTSPTVMAASGSWQPTASSPRARNPMSPYDHDRQVRFQSSNQPGASLSSNRSTQFGSASGSGVGGGNGYHQAHSLSNSSSSAHHPSSSANPPYGVKSMGYPSGANNEMGGSGGNGQTQIGQPTAQFADSHASSQYRSDASHDLPYLPSPAHFFSGSNTRPNFDQGGGGSTASSGGGPSGTALAVDHQSSNAVAHGLPVDPSNPAMVDYLQGSILPPLSTSMADALFNNQGMFTAEHLFDESSLPPLISAGSGQQTMLDMLGACLPASETPGSVDSASVGGMESVASYGGFGSDAPQTESKSQAGNGGKSSSGRASGGAEPAASDENHPLSDSVLIPTLALFYERLGGVMPVFSRNWIFTRLDRDDHQTDVHFAAMLLAMSALTMIQAQPNNNGSSTNAEDAREKKGERISSRKRRAKANRLLKEALRLREGPSMGQHASLEMCCTSFFVFATLFGLGEHSAAWYRLRESITLAHLCRLHEPAAYENLEKDEAERRLRAYWLLAITERAFAIQRGMPLALTGNPRASTAQIRAKLGFKELSDFPDLQLRLFDHVDEKFVDCWNRKCQGPGCANFDAERAIALWRSFTDGINQPNSRERSVNGEAVDDDSTNSSDGSARIAMVNTSSSGNPTPTTPSHRRQIQRADVEVTRHWLLNRLWLITLNHGLLSIDAKDPPLRVDHAIHVAQSVYDVCDSLSLSAMEAHGVGFPYKLFDIAQTLVLLCKDEMIAEAISKGGVGEQLEKQTTAAHTSGRLTIEEAKASSDQSNASGERGRSMSSSSSTRPKKVDPYTGMMYDGNDLSIYDDDSSPHFPPGFVFSSAATSGPASLRRTVLGILNEYLTLFQKFRDGDHPYLEKLIELIADLKMGSDSTNTSPAHIDAGATVASTTMTDASPSNASHPPQLVGHEHISMDTTTSHRSSADHMNG